MSFDATFLLESASYIMKWCIIIQFEKHLCAFVYLSKNVGNGGNAYNIMQYHELYRLMDNY